MRCSQVITVTLPLPTPGTLYSFFYIAENDFGPDVDGVNACDYSDALGKDANKPECGNRSDILTIALARLPGAATNLRINRDFQIACS